MNIWNIVNNLSYDDNIKIEDIFNNLCKYQENHVTFLLNKNNKSIIELFINDIVEYHTNRLNIKDEIFVEFWFKSYNNIDKNTFHIDCDEYDKCINKSSEYNSPFLSCITYLNDNNTNPTVITDIDKDKYKYKIFDSKLYISLPKKMKHITFEGGKYYHGESKLLLEDSIRNILVINLWNKKPLNVPFFDFEYFIFKYSMNEKKEIKLVNMKDKHFTLQTTNNQIVIQTTILNNDFFDNLLYKDMSNLFDLKDIIDKYNSYDLIVFENNKINNNNININSDKDDNQSIIDVSLDKFKQRFIIKNHFTKDICKWIIEESENYASLNGWTKTRHNKYPTTDLPVELLPSIFSFLMVSFKYSICIEIHKNYSLTQDYTFQIIDAFIVKYDMDNQKLLEMHTDTGCITVNILLSDPSDFTGGGTYFEDDITIKLNQGDMLIHSSNSKHAGLEITQGKRYVLVFFINLLL
jgi:hypothetical protein